MFSLFHFAIKLLCLCGYNIIVLHDFYDLMSIFDGCLNVCIFHRSIVFKWFRLNIVEEKSNKKIKHKNVKKKVAVSLLSSSEIVAADSPSHGVTSDMTHNLESSTSSLSKSLFNSLKPEENVDGDANSNEQSLEDYDDEYDEIHSIENVDPKTLLHTLMHKEKSEKRRLVNTDRTGKDGKLSGNIPVEHLDGDSAIKALTPSAPRDLVAQLLNRYVTLSWMEPAKNPDEVISYTVFYRMSSSERLVSSKRNILKSIVSAWCNRY